MTRQQALDEAERLMQAGFPDDASRQRFDSIMLDIERMDGDAAPASEPGVVPVSEAPAERLARAQAHASGLTGRRRLLAAQTSEIEARGAYPAEGVVVSGSSYTAAGLRRFLESAPAGFHDEIQRQLNEAEDRAFRREQIDAADRERSERLARARLDQDEYERREREEELRAAREAAERANTTEARLGRMEAVLLEIRDGLRGR